MGKNNQKGFTSFEAVIIVVALVAIGSAGYFAYQARQDKTNYSVNIPKRTTASSKSKVTDSSSLTLQQAVDATRTVYGKVIADWDTGPMTGVVKNNSSLFTSDFVAQSQYGGSKNNGNLPLVCGGNGITKPDNVQYAGKTYNRSGASVTVAFVYAGSNNATWQANLVAQNGRWLFDGLTCQ